MKHLPNILSASRIALCLPLLLADAMTVPFWVLYVIAGTTDMLDGFLARRWGVESKFGARLDSLADFVLVLAVGYKLFPWLKLPTTLWMMIGLVALIPLSVPLFLTQTPTTSLSVCCPFMPQQQNNNNVIDIKNFIFILNSATL